MVDLAHATVDKVILEPAAQKFADATSKPPFLYQLPPAEGRAAVEQVQSSSHQDVKQYDPTNVTTEELHIDTGKYGQILLQIITPTHTTTSPTSKLPCIMYSHGAGWVFGSRHTHGRLVRELAAKVNAVVVFPEYTLSPEAKYPVALEQLYAALQWAYDHADQLGIDSSRMAVAGDSVGGNLTIGVTMLAAKRHGVKLSAQLLFYPVTDNNFDTASYMQFATGYFLARDGMKWFWQQYTDGDTSIDTVRTPLKAPIESLSGLPPAMVITGEADVLRDEGEQYAAHLRQAGVEVTACRYGGMIHDFVMLNPLRSTQAAEAAIAAAVTFLIGRLK